MLAIEIRQYTKAHGGRSLVPRFTSLEDAQQTLDAWREDYNNVRPHGSLEAKTPAEYRRGGHYVPDRDRIENSLR